MRTQIRLTAAALFLLVGVAAAQTAPATLSARLVTASKDAGTTDARLNDVLALLQSTLSFKSFRLEGEATVELREGATASLAKGYRLDLSQVQDNKATVRVSQNQRDLTQTTLTLRQGSPVIVGGYADPAGGKTIIILKLK